MIGTSLDKYDVLQKVGEGGMATVYRGRHATLNRDVAIKVLHPHLSSSTRNRKRFAREARAIEHLRHDNILEIFDYSGSNAEECYIVTEFVQGETLTELMDRRGRMSSEVAALIGLSLAHALDYAHRAGVLHRDLKPDNVMIRFDGTVKLMDFGIARFLDESQVTMTGALVGSPAFMSPEQAREADLDARSDLYSLGTLLYYLVSGLLPFTGSNPSLILRNIIEGNRPHLAELAPGTSATLADVIESLLQTNRDDRPNTAGDVATLLEEVLAETDLDPTEPRWSLRSFVEDPEAWERRLQEHLLLVLVEKGRAALDEGNHLVALRLFNRLLSIDEENTEVLELVQSLHGEPELHRSWLGPLVVAALVLLTATGITAWVLWGPALSGEEVGYAKTQVAEAGGLAVAATSRAEPGSTPGPTTPTTDPPARVSPSPTGSLAASPATIGAAPAAAPEPMPPRRAVLPPTPVVSRIRSLPPSTPDTDADTTPTQSDPVVRFGFISIKPRDGWAQIYANGQPIGNTREADPFRIAAGTYDVELRSEYIETLELKGVEVKPDATWRATDVELTYKPLVLRFDAAYDAGCRVAVNGKDVGLVGEDHVLQTPKPKHEELLVHVRCGAEQYAKSWTGIPGLDLTVGPPETLDGRP